MAHPGGRPTDYTPELGESIYRSSLSVIQQKHFNYAQKLKQKFLNLLTAGKLNSKECADTYVELKMNGAMISLDWPPRVELYKW